MRSFVSVLVLAAALTMVVPDNGAQAVNAVESSYGSVAAASAAGHVATREADDRAIDSDASWLLALGFLGAVMARRLRAE